jgi:hypothetical protein
MYIQPAELTTRSRGNEASGAHKINYVSEENALRNSIMSEVDALASRTFKLAELVRILTEKLVAVINPNSLCVSDKDCQPNTLSRPSSSPLVSELRNIQNILDNESNAVIYLIESIEL